MSPQSWGKVSVPVANRYKVLPCLIIAKDGGHDVLSQFHTNTWPPPQTPMTSSRIATAFLLRVSCSNTISSSASYGRLVGSFLIGENIPLLRGYVHLSDDRNEIRHRPQPDLFINGVGHRYRVQQDQFLVVVGCQIQGG